MEQQRLRLAQIKSWRMDMRPVRCRICIVICIEWDLLVIRRMHHVHTMGLLQGTSSTTLLVFSVKTSAQREWYAEEFREYASRWMQVHCLIYIQKQTTIKHNLQQKAKHDRCHLWLKISKNIADPDIPVKHPRNWKSFQPQAEQTPLSSLRNSYTTVMRNHAKDCDSHARTKLIII